MKSDQTEFWETKFWHNQVHERLGETLYYFLARVTPFNLSEASARLTKLFAERHLGGIRIFPIFGTYDLMVRAWLPSSTASAFRGWLDSTLGGSSHAVHPFVVDHIDRVWYGGITDYELLENLNEDTIRDVQSGTDQTLLQKLIEGGLVALQGNILTGTVSFFITINLEAGTDSILAEAVAEINRFVDVHSEFKNISIYRGFGFCSILLEGQSVDYSTIFMLPDWINGKFKSFGVRTETYLVQGQGHTISNEVVGEATFAAIRGRSLFVQSVVPELYEILTPKRHSVEQFLVDKVLGERLTQRDKKLLHDYLLGYMTDDASQIARTLFTFFVELEGYLRENHKEFLRRVTKPKLSFRELCQTANIDQTKRFLSLGDLLVLYTLAAKSSQQGRSIRLPENWYSLMELRNRIAHGDMDFLSNWDKSLEQLLEYLPSIRELLSLVESVTKEPYSLYY